MIPNITKGDKPVGLMKYLVGPGRANEHTDPHLVGGSPLIMAWHDDVQLNEEAAVAIAREVDLNRRMLGFDADIKHVWHCSLSIPYQDREVTDQEWSDIAARFMDEMDFTEAGAKAPCPWVAVHHGRSTKGNDHIHIMASTIREDGTKWADGNDFSRAQKVARGIEKDFQLIQLGNHSERWLQQGEIARDSTREPTRFTLERTVRACAVAADTEAQFVRLMRRANMLVHPRFAAGTDSVVTGYSVAERPPLRVDDAPGVAVEVTRATSLNPSVGMIQRLENQVRALPEEVTKREARLASARQEVVDARAALEMPFKHQDALEAARWEVERIGRAMRGEETPQPSLDPELEALKKRMRINFPDAPTAGRSSAGRGGNGSGRPLEVARRHEDQRPREGEMEL